MTELSHKRKMMVMVAIMVAMFFSAINQTIVSTAMPKIITILGGMDLYSWVITIYMLTSTIATVIVGKLSDIYGRRPFLLGGIIIFIIGAFLSGLATDIYEMITYRGVQGVGAGIIMATSITAVGDLFSPRERGKWTGLMMAVFGFSSVLGPPLGGWLVDHTEWKWLFWVFLPLGILAFIMILFYFPKTDKNKSESIDYLGAIFLSSAIVAVLLGFSWAGTKYPWGSLELMITFLLGIVFLLLFIIVQMVVKSPILPLSLFKNSIVTISNSVGFIMNAGMMGALIYLPFFVQGVMGVTPTYSGYVTMPMSIAMVIVSTVTGRLITKTGKYKRYAVAGFPVMIVGMLMMAYMNSIWMAVMAMTVFGLGLGVGMPVFTITIQNAVHPKELGVATASSQLFRNLGGTIGIAIMGTIMQTSLVREMKNSTPADLDLSKMDAATAEQLAPLSSSEILLNQPELERIVDSMPQQIQALANQLIEVLRDALSASLTTVFLSGVALISVALILVFFLREIPLRTTIGVPEESSKQPEPSEQ